MKIRNYIKKLRFYLSLKDLETFRKGLIPTSVFIFLETPDLETAEKKMKDTQLAADVLTQIQKALGANPENSVEETHSLADFLRKNMENYDEEIAKDIIATQNAQTRSKIIVNDDGTKESAELTNAKRKLENDRAKEREIQQELKELKDVELITTELELAKYLATENARHQVQFARALVTSRPPPPPPPPAVQQVEYAPITYQQPAFSYMPPPSVEVPRQPVIMAAPWQQYPQAINYAYGPSHMTSGNIRNEMDALGGGRVANVYNQPSYEAMKMRQASLARPSSFQQAIEAPQPSTAIHTEAQSRHVTKPTIAKPKQYKQRKQFNTRFYPKPRPYGQSTASNSHREQPSASLVGGKPTITFPGPTYSPPPLWARAGRPKNRYSKNQYKSYSNRFNLQQQTRRPSSPALQSFFIQQNQAPHFGNLYQTPAFLAQQHGPVFTEEAYKVPMVAPVHYQLGEYHSVEKEQPHFDIHAPFTSQIENRFNSYHAPEYSLQNQREQSPSKTQIPASNTQFSAVQATDYVGTQHGVANQYALPRPQGPSFGAPPQVMYQAPASYAETVASSKGGIPSFYTPYYALPLQPAAPVQQQFVGYTQTAQPFETMNTDSENFHSQAPPQEKAPNKAPKAKDQENVPLGYGLYPLPENADTKMEDKEGMFHSSF